MTTTETTHQPPVERIRRGRITAAIRHQSGDKGVYYTFSLERSYRDASGNWKSTSSFGLQDALLVAKVANLADSKIRALLDADYAESRVQQEEEELA